MLTRRWLGATVLAWCSVCACARPDSHDDSPLRVTHIDLRACGPESPEALMGCVDSDAWMRDVRVIARPRPPGSQHWMRVQELCASRLTELGFEVGHHAFGSGTNVIGTRLGPDPSVLVIVAHYDGIEDCDTADDGASGLAALLETSRVLAASSFDKSLVVACLDQGATTSAGSMVEAVSTFARGTPLVGAIAFGSVGYASQAPASQRLPADVGLFLPELESFVGQREYRADFLNVVGSETSRHLLAAFGAHAPSGMALMLIEAPAALRRRPEFAVLRRAAHAGYWSQGYPALLLTDTAEFRNPNHRCRNGSDNADTLSPEFAKSVIQVTVGASASLLGIARCL